MVYKPTNDLGGTQLSCVVFSSKNSYASPGDAQAVCVNDCLNKTGSERSQRHGPARALYVVVGFCGSWILRISKTFLRPKI